MKRELDGIKSSIDDLRSETGALRAVTKRMAAGIVRLEGRMDDMERRFSTLATKTDISAIMKKFDAFIAANDEFRFKWAVHTDMLAGHEKRITRLENRRP